MSLLVPYDRNRYPACVVRHSRCIDLMHPSGLVYRIINHPISRLKCPALITHKGINHRHRDHCVQAFQLTVDYGAMGPRTSQGYIQVVAVGFRFKATSARGACTTICRYPITKTGGFSFKTPTRSFGVVPISTPLSINK